MRQAAKMAAIFALALALFIAILTSLPKPTINTIDLTDRPQPETVGGWKLSVTGPVARLGNALADLESLMSDARPDSTEWRDDIAAQLAVIRASYRSLTEIIPPPDIAPVHVALIEATQDCNDMTTHLQAAIDNLDRDESATAAALMRSCAAKFTEAARIIEGVTR